MTRRRLVSTLELEEAGASRSNAGEGRWPVWSRDGRELFYRNLDAHVRVPVQAGSAFGTPELLSRDVATYQTNPGAHFDAASDGRLLVIRDLGAGDGDGGGTFPNRIVVVQNWFEDLRERLEANR